MTGDFNGDGKADFAVACQNAAGIGGGEVDVFLGNGDGTFQAPLPYTALGSVYQLVVGDFNGDGKADLATLGGGNPAPFSIALGNGDGTFGVSFSYSTTSAEAYLIAAGDFNGDGNADLAIALNSNFPTNGTLEVYLGNGNGTFQPLSATLVTPVSPIGIAIGDVNGDGKADVVLTEAYSNTGYPTVSSVSVFLGNSNGTLQPGVNYNLSEFPAAVAISDFNGDGKPDLAVGPDGGSQVGILLGSGDGTFQSPLYYSSGPEPSQSFNIIVADFNGDGKADVAATDGSNSDLAYVLLGATFGPSSTSLTSSPNPSTFGKTVTLTATVLPVAASGSVTFYNPPYTLGTAALNAGTATFETSSLPVGNDKLRASYSGDSQDAPSTSAAVVQQVSKAASSTVLSSSPNPSTFSQSVTFTATVSPATATGNVTFYHGSSSLGSASLGGGLATLTLSTLSVGPDAITADYSGDQSYEPSTSASLTQTVRDATSTVLTSSPNPSNPGQAVLLTATVSRAAQRER